MPAANRSAKTNGRRRFVDGDGRGPWARRWRDLQELYADDLGGAAALSEFQLGLLGTAATLRCELERLEGCLSLGQPIDLDLFGREPNYRDGVDFRKHLPLPKVNIEIIIILYAIQNKYTK